MFSQGLPRGGKVAKPRDHRIRLNEGTTSLFAPKRVIFEGVRQIRLQFPSHFEVMVAYVKAFMSIQPYGYRYLAIRRCGMQLVSVRYLVGVTGKRGENLRAE